MPAPLQVVVLAAGEGTRLRGRQTKVLTPLWGRPSVAWPVDAARALGPERVVVVGGAHLEALGKALADRDVTLAHQIEPRGTGHAVLAARDALQGAEGSLLILYGDCPLLPHALLEQLVAAHRAHPGPVTLLSIELDDPTGYGRIVRAADGSVQSIVEEKDATPEQRALLEVNAGIWVVDLPGAWSALEGLTPDNSQNELYLTDLVGLAVADGQRVEAFRWGEPEDVLGFNDQAQLAEVREILRRRILAGHMANGVEIVDPATTYVDADVTIASGARILPCTMIEGKVSIATGCDVGPLAHLRDGTVMEEGSKVGNFTETKKSVLGPGVKAGHLTYLGDARIGAGTNIGAGTITANYDGTNKHPTRIGERVFIGSGTVLVAPTEIGDGALTGAGAIVTGNSTIGEGEVWVGVPARPQKPATSAKAPSEPQTEEPKA
jgi:bifunctional UDP-N-acetylglucosamine pyrophosphorylase/glucosamine-1-phosphate N-acetyltransferase